MWSVRNSLFVGRKHPQITFRESVLRTPRHPFPASMPRASRASRPPLRSIGFLTTSRLQWPAMILLQRGQRSAFCVDHVSFAMEPRLISDDCFRSVGENFARSPDASCAAHRPFDPSRGQSLFEIMRNGPASRNNRGGSASVCVSLFFFSSFWCTTVRPPILFFLYFLT